MMKLRLRTINGTRLITSDGADGWMDLTVQRNLNPWGLPVEQRYEILARRPMSSGEQEIQLAGREGVRREDGADAETIFVPLTGTDVLIHPKNRSIRARLEHVLATIRFKM